MPDPDQPTLTINTRVRVHHVRPANQTGDSARCLQRMVSSYIGLEGAVGEHGIIYSKEMVLGEFTKPAGPYTCLLFYPDELEVVSGSQNEATPA